MAAYKQKLLEEWIDQHGLAGMVRELFTIAEERAAGEERDSDNWWNWERAATFLDRCADDIEDETGL